MSKILPTVLNFGYWGGPTFAPGVDPKAQGQWGGWPGRGGKGCPGHPRSVESEEYVVFWGGGQNPSQNKATHSGVNSSQPHTFTCKFTLSLNQLLTPGKITRQPVPSGGTETHAQAMVRRGRDIHTTANDG